jgi:hypothetical protein
MIVIFHNLANASIFYILVDCKTVLQIRSFIHGFVEDHGAETFPFHCPPS